MAGERKSEEAPAEAKQEGELFEGGKRPHLSRKEWAAKKRADAEAEMERLRLEILALREENAALREDVAALREALAPAGDEVKEEGDADADVDEGVPRIKQEEKEEGEQ